MDVLPAETTDGATPISQSTVRAQTFPSAARQTVSTSENISSELRIATVTVTHGAVQLRYAPVNPRPKPEETS